MGLASTGAESGNGGGFLRIGGKVLEPGPRTEGSGKGKDANCAMLCGIRGTGGTSWFWLEEEGECTAKNIVLFRKKRSGRKNNYLSKSLSQKRLC